MICWSSAAPPTAAAAAAAEKPRPHSLCSNVYFLSNRKIII
jgi:hypothetical protein